MFEFFIAKRYLKSKHRINLISIISLLSTLGITIGVAALVIVLSVFNGFGSLVTSMLVNFDPHVVISAKHADAQTNLEQVENILKNDGRVTTFYPYTEGKIILINRNQYHVLNLKGITEHKESQSWGIQSVIVKGELNLNSHSEIDEVVVGQRMALRLSCNVGDTLFVTSFKNLERMATSFTSIPQIRKAIVTGVFVTHNKDYDVEYAFSSLHSAQNILSTGNIITGFELRLKDISDSEEVKSFIQSNIDTKLFSVRTWYDLHKDLYSVMLIERWGAFILLTLIISVATFNILGSLTMSVIEKQKDIGVLRAMGTKVKSLIRIFTFEGMLIGIIGTTAGLIIGLVTCFVQINYKIYPLDPSKYIIDAIPIEIRVSDILFVTIASLILTFAASLYPAKKAAKVNVISAINYE